MVPINITVEVVFALPKVQFLRQVILEIGATVESAICSSGVLKAYKDIDLKKNKIGVYGKLVKLTDLVKNGDRVEIYRPLVTNLNRFSYRRVKRL